MASASAREGWQAVKTYRINNPRCWVARCTVCIGYKRRHYIDKRGWYSEKRVEFASAADARQAIDGVPGIVYRVGKVDRSGWDHGACRARS